MGRFVAIDSPAMDALVADAVKGIGAEIAARRIPKLRGQQLRQAALLGTDPQRLDADGEVPVGIKN